MNVGEAHHLNILLGWLLGRPKFAPEHHVPTDEEACDSAAWLASRAHQTLRAGLNGEKVGVLWDKRPDARSPLLRHSYALAPWLRHVPLDRPLGPTPWRPTAVRS